MSTRTGILQVDSEDTAISPIFGELLSLLGFFSLILALLVGYLSPASGYEVSIYASTPILFWISIGIATTCGITLAFSRTVMRPIRWLGYLLSAWSILTIVAIPVVRGYYFFGAADSLTHLGWVKDLTAARLGVIDFLYPGVHTTSIFLSRLTGLSFQHSLELVVLLFCVVFIVFIPLTVQQLADGWWAVPIGILAALLFVPINNTSTFRMTHPSTQAILFAPLLLYLVFLCLDEQSENHPGRLPFSIYRTDILLVVTGISLILVHPQIATSFVGFLLAIAVLQLAKRLRKSEPYYINTRFLAGHTLILGTVLLYWIRNKERAQNTSATIIEGFIDYFTGQEQVAEEAAQRGGSLSEIGASIEILFLKLFGVSLVLSLIAAILILFVIRRRWNGSLALNDTFILYTAVGLVFQGVVFLVYFFASHTTQHYRQLGFIMVVITVLAAAALTRGVVVGTEYLAGDSARKYGSVIPSGVVLTGTTLLLITLLVASIPALYFSPYIFKASSQVPEGHVDGFETTYDTLDEEYAFTGIRSSGYRYRDAIYGVAESRNVDFQSSDIPPPVFNAGNYSQWANESRYLGISDRDIQREFNVLRGLRYERQGLDRLRTNPQAHRIISNQQYRAYLLSVQE